MTSFALLLDSGGGSGKGNPCTSEADDVLLYTYISSGLVFLALVIISIAVIGNEIQYRRRDLARKRTLEWLTQQQAPQHLVQ